MSNAIPSASEAREIAASWFVPLRTTGTRPPFFFVAQYLDMGRHFSPAQPYYGIVLALDVRAALPGYSFSQVAALALQQIRKVQPKGPYYLGGYCFSAVLVFEMALQLRDQGEEVAYLALVDAAIPLNLKPKFPPGPSFGKKLLKKFNPSKLLHPIETVQNALRAREENANIVALNLDGDKPQADFHPRVLDIPVDAFVCREGSDPQVSPDDPRFTWKAWCSELTPHFVEGNHVSLLREPVVREFVPHLEKRLNEAQARQLAKARAAGVA